MWGWHISGAVKLCNKTPSEKLNNANCFLEQKKTIALKGGMNDKGHTCLSDTQRISILQMYLTALLYCHLR